MPKQDKQPVALPICFLTEMWERYGFYLVQVAIVLFLVHFFHYSESLSGQLAGTFIGLVYTTSILGGMVADRWLGHFVSAVVGEYILIICYSLIGMSVILYNPYWLLVGLSGVAVGTGLVKANISALLSNFYQPNAPQREQGYSIFYTGINLGAVLGSLTAGIITTWIFDGFLSDYDLAWALPFFLCAIGAFIGFLTLQIGIKKNRIDIEQKQRDKNQWSDLAVALGYILLTWIGCILILRFTALSTLVFSILLIGCIVILITDGIKYPTYRFYILGIAGLLIISVVFWTLYFQFYTSYIGLFSSVFRSRVFGFEFSVPFYLSFINIGVVLFGGLLGRIWLKFEKQGRPIHYVDKFLLGLGLAGLATWVITSSITIMPLTMLVPGLTLILACLILALADLSLSPIGLSATCQLAPPKRQGVYMGIWLISIGLGGKIAGLLSFIMNESDQQPLHIIHEHYIHGMWINSLIAAAFIIFGLVIRRPLKRLI